ncbi:pumilio homolog 23 [Malania oleifera]|uniref:pumilio homolog 23 n=1 Tax=Malania oleifera TaxID=397392 RepID=UPI0025AE6348|nr:pumilio homolog 23 [Malania oleifera]XP_057980902.1 pumilio homolog 23 [Malania oleifera]XP_057980903.1 pumilio homolog 23 [Malania oleifera]XP_057980905.1 pumilio homolog 23 [Malania oleifera]XP_057980906.1 pumilio homolog 23 [Malania oleifera]XP_057980907.1 pumilio homolog 23 [Malania oleifera]
MRRSKAHNLADDSLMDKEDTSYKQGRRKKGIRRNQIEENLGSDGDHSAKCSSGHVSDKAVKAQKSLKHQNKSVPQILVRRKQVDPETAKYFLEIANVLEGGEVELEERSVICGNALEETRGKELELATDYIISHTLQSLLEGCDADHLCGFLLSCANDFPRIAMDRSGSHVAETALKSLVVHPQDEDAHSFIEETLTTICKVIAVNPVDVICNCYGSHVVRSLLCLCKGAPVDSTEFHFTNSSTVLAQRLNLKASQLDGNESSHLQLGFPDLLKFLVLEMLKHARKDIRTLQVNQFSSLVLQTALKVLVGDDELLQIIPVLLGCSKDYFAEGSSIENSVVQDTIDLMKETAFSHLMEVILEVAPETLYDEMFRKIFRNSLFEISSHPRGNFVVQALVSHAKCQGQMELIWEELGTKFMDLLEMGRSGVIASLIAASQRLHTHEHKCCQALAAAVQSVNESPRCIVPRILFLESYFGCEDKSDWNWPNGTKMHVMGSLILQAIFRFRSEFVHPYITSITSLEVDHVLETAQDASGARVLEAFLSSHASEKQKHKLVSRLRGRFGGLSMRSSGSFTVEKCFSVSNMSLREVIVTELLAVQNELSKTKQGPYLLRRLDVDGFAARPDQWRSKQVSKQSVYKKFCAAFGSNERKSSKNDKFLAYTSNHIAQADTIKKMRKEIDQCLASGTPLLGSQSAVHEVSLSKLGKSGFKRHQERMEKGSIKLAKHAVDDDVLRSKAKKRKNKKKE